MPDLSATFDIPNPFGLLAGDFRHDLDGYRAALGFLSDLAGGSDHDEALTSNGGSHAMLTGWKGSDKFRRVYAKCQAAGKAEREEAVRRAESDSAATEGEGEGNPQGQRFVPLGEAPVVRRVFGMQPNRSSWGEA